MIKKEKYIVKPHSAKAACAAAVAPVPSQDNSQYAGTLPATPEVQNYTTASAEDKKELNNMMNNPQSTAPAKPTKKWSSFKSKLITPTKGKIKTVFRRLIKFTVPPILIALAILVAAEKVPDFKENFEMLYRFADFYVGLCEELLKLGIHSINLAIHFITQIFGNEDPTAVESFLKSFANIGEVLKNFWMYIRAL